MSYEQLEQQLKTLPEEYLEEVAKYVQLLQYKLMMINAQKEKPKTNGIVFGLGKGMFSVPDDIHAGDELVAEEFEDYL